ncbi:MAG TPA: aminotransferase class I/II-fold pyridoxal phosphate-dependent enzyme [Rhizomicrobium sp.]|nr:aminotransferase class I/II-fold pyridoxal phosphate-dependent enzyme [Rhizomicrobium sp.]
MTGESRTFGLSNVERQRLIERFRDSGKAQEPIGPTPNQDPFQDLEYWRQFEMIRMASESLGIANPFYRVHEGVGGAGIVRDGRRYLNFASYNYLGLNGHPRVSAAAKQAIDDHGTSASASRLLTGERSVHVALERSLAELHGTEDCISFVSGHATNVTVLGCLLGRPDLILYDALSHNSIQQGAQLSGARRLSFPHNDVAAAERLLAQHRGQCRQALIAIEGHYSMDGDVPDLPAFAEIARRHKAWLLVDEAHSVGVLGRHGRGIAEHFGVDGALVDFWMGTLSKALAGCGGYIACSRRGAEYLRYAAPGFVYSVGMPPPIAAACAASLDVLREEPERVARLNANAALFLARAKEAGLDTGLSQGFGIVPVIIGSSVAAARLSEILFARGINVKPILYPAVPEQGARLRFFLSSEHTAAEIGEAVTVLAEEVARMKSGNTGLPETLLR